MKGVEPLEPIIPSYFSWREFYSNLDRALATYLEDGGSINDGINKFAGYSHNRILTPKKLMDDMLRNDSTDTKEETK